MDCGVDTGKINEYYMLVDEVWYSVHDSGEGMLCIGCIEKRLGRELTPADFHECLLNTMSFPAPKSNRLMQRLGL